jgi:dienelactone hydrolase
VFLYFPDNYMWSLAFMRALMSGALLGELHRIGRRLAPAQTAPPNGDLAAWFDEWHGLAKQVESRGRDALALDRTTTAADDLMRATHYYQWAEAFLPSGDARKVSTIERHLECFRDAIALRPDGIEIVEVPYLDRSLPAYFVPASVEGGAAVVLFGGLDSCKEELITFALKLAARGIAVLSVDGPGQAEALKLRGIRSRFDYEVPAGAALDYLAGRPEIDPDRIGLIGASMGGYYCARAAAFEPRFAAAVAYGAQYDYRETWIRRLNIQPGSPIAAPAHHLFDVLGVESWEAALAVLEAFTLRGVAGRISCPFLIVHGENDRQILPEDAAALYEEIGSEVKELRIFKDEEGGSAHCQIDCPEPAQSYMADWLADRLGVSQRAPALAGEEDRWVD